jgi:hypothetical protein
LRTIGKHRPGSSPIGDTQSLCAYCGVKWLRSRLRVDEAGNLVCPDEGQGRDMVELSRENSDRARKRNRLPRQQKLGGTQKPTFSLPAGDDLRTVMSNGGRIIVN